MTNISSYKAFPSAFAIVSAAALAFTGLIASTTPAHAMATSTDYRCTALAEQAKDAADKASGDEKGKAERFVAIGDKLCDAGNERAAAKQFRAALKIAHVDEVKSDSRLAAK